MTTAASLPEVDVQHIADFNHWDQRACKVANTQEWLAACKSYKQDGKYSTGGFFNIPKHIHQIWIGPKEPPCVWLDSWRTDYLREHPHWKYTQWDDERVAALDQVNRDLYDSESMWQCKADILRLEILWHYGGVYIDADMITMGNPTRSIDTLLEQAKSTGWGIAYEPDTKDKPISVFGNSVIACTAHHPLTMMLIKYMRNTYSHLRPHIEVFQVTGPVMYTKCLEGMPLTVWPQELLYPAFHFVPDPNAIDYTQFPKALMFQFGYTCSGLEGWVKANNKCRRARQCPFHRKKTDWPLGPWKEIPKEADKPPLGRPVPKVIHQFTWHPQESGVATAPFLRQCWYDRFLKEHNEYQYKSWTLKELQGRPWFQAYLYKIENMDAFEIGLLALELIYQEGGF